MQPDDGALAANTDAAIVEPSISTTMVNFRDKRMIKSP
jgi:hypothetical protein